MTTIIETILAAYALGYLTGLVSGARRMTRLLGFTPPNAAEIADNIRHELHRRP